MKILFGTDLFYQNTAGSSNFIHQLSNGLIKKGHEIFVIAPSKTYRNTLSKEGDVTVYGIHSVVIPEMIYPSGFRIPITTGSNHISKIIKEVNPNIIHVQDHFMIGDKIAKEGKKLGIPLIGTNHFMPENFIHYLYPPKFAEELVKKLAWKTFTRVYKNLDLITTPTQTAVDLITDLGLNNRIIPISNGVNLEKFNPKNDGNYLRKQYQITSKEAVILFVGRLDKEKHIDVLIKAFSKIISQTSARLVIAGKGTERASLNKLVKRLHLNKQVIFTGFVPNQDLPFLYRMASVFVIASIAELQSIATMEAMASGLPVIAAKVIALPELVHHGENGYLFNPEDTDMLASQMIKILKDPLLQKSMSSESLRIIKKHDINNTIESYEKAYKELSKS